MNKILLTIGILLCFNGVFAQSNIISFDSTWRGYNTMITGVNIFPKAFQLTDLDNDGDSDVVVAQGIFGNAFSVLINQGNGFYSQPVQVATQLSGLGIAAGDFNNDGKKDVVVSNTGQNYEGTTVSIFFGNGNGTFGTPVNISVGAGPAGITTADFNNDGKLDFAVANYGFIGQGTTVSVVLGNGNGTFQSQLIFPAGNGPTNLKAGKLNGDNLPDLVVSNENGNMNVLMNSGGNNFSGRIEYTPPSPINGGANDIDLADLDNDGDLDIALANGGFSNGDYAEVAVFKNNGSGVFGIPVRVQSVIFSDAAVDISIADLNGDGWKDLVFTSRSARTTDGYVISLNNGSGGFLPAVLHSAGQSTALVMTGDADNDGITDVLTGDDYSMQVTFHKNYGNALFPSPARYSIPNITGSLDAADIDGDGDLDVLTSASGIAAIGVPVSVLKNNGNGTFSSAVNYSIRSGGVQGKLRDLNNDGRPDIIFASAISSPPYDFHYAINNGDGTFGAVQTKQINACGWSDIDAFDMNNDGFKDVVITEWLGCQNIGESARRIFICLNNGNGTFANPIIKVVNPFPSALVGADFNGDGKIDIATGHSLSVSIHLGTGTGDIGTPLNYPVEQSPYDMVAADFNNDGKLDLAACTEYEHEGMSVLLGNGDGTFQPAQNYFGAYSPDLRNESGIAAGDVDNDGDKDILVSNAASNDISVYINNGSGTFSFKMRYGASWSASGIVFKDFTGDGKLDIITATNLPPAGFQSALIMIRGKNTGIVGINSALTSAVPENYILSQNFPNPFNPVTRINYALPKAGVVTLKVYDVLGKETAVLVNEYKNAGNYTAEFNGTSMPSGIYFYKLSSGNFTSIKKMSLVK
jgi:hypothetical protein